MFGSVGVPELIMIFIVALLLFGPKKLPEIGKSLGRAMGEFKRATNDLKRSLEEEVAAEDVRGAKRDLEGVLKDVMAATPPTPPPAAVAEETKAIEPVTSAPEGGAKPGEPTQA
jgi:TatA/E family protein of Tat protein translocase